MSTGTKVSHAVALEQAKEIVDALTPFVKRVKVAGSLRRQRPEVSDIELVIEPTLHTIDLLGGTGPDIDSVRQVLGTFGRIVKGGDRYICTQLHTGLQCDAFLVHPPANYFVILAIRTGPAKLGQWAVTRMHDYGLRCENGRIIRKATGEEYEVLCEADFFAAARLRYVVPARRDLPGAFRPADQPTE